MKILKLEAENFKRLKAVNITPKGNLVQITGRNANGKTSVLDAIWAALGGATHIQSQPIRTGATKARIKLDLGEIIVTRSITEKGSTLTVENAEGLAYKSPQRMLDDLVGALAFDPLAFTRMKPREQFDQLKGIAKVDLDLDSLDALNRRDFERRADLNREAKQLRAQLDGLPVPSTVAEPMDLSALLGERQRLQDTRTATLLAGEKRRGREQDLERLRKEIEVIRASFNQKKQAIEELEEELESSFAEAGGADYLQQLTGHIEAINTEILTAQDHNNSAIDARRILERREDIEARATATEAKASDLTEEMEARTRTKQEAIARAKMPVAGLGFGDGVVLYNGVPFDQASSAEQLRVSVSIAMASNPKLRVIRIQDGSLLDDASLSVIAEMAQEHDMQIWLEMVSNSNDIGIVIEDGSVLVDNQSKGQDTRGTK